MAASKVRTHYRLVKQATEVHFNHLIGIPNDDACISFVFIFCKADGGGIFVKRPTSSQVWGSLMRATRVCDPQRFFWCSLPAAMLAPWKAPKRQLPSMAFIPYKFYWCSDGVARGQNVLNSNWKCDFVAMATAVYALIPSKIWLNLKATQFGNTMMYWFLHPFLYLFSYSRLTIWIFGDHKPEPQTALMTWVDEIAAAKLNDCCRSMAAVFQVSA